MRRYSDLKLMGLDLHGESLGMTCDMAYYRYVNVSDSAFSSSIAIDFGCFF
jgi:hypothetical protein